MMNLVFTFIRGQWKFNSAVTDEVLPYELKYLDGEGTRYKVVKVDRFDIDKVRTTEDSLNK
jgi:hypothetical protein